ncbi:MAG: ABC transporter permease subunit [Gemmatimonadota bacterium]|jgi:ABC-type transport system involved in multi-copper enzyme maturation permease subunit|nr:MAG: ABC transporter permease subunit [Gemmatimonadota bacterium]
MTLRLLARAGVRDSMRAYWFWLNAAIFVAGGLLLMLFGQVDVFLLGYRSYGRALAGLMQLALFVVPLMSLLSSAAAIAGARETGALEYLLAQPVTRREVFAGKWLGVAAAVVASIVVGYGATGAVAAAKGVPGLPIAVLLLFTVILSAAFVSLGLWVSAVASTRARATSVVFTLWLVFLALGSLGLMSAFVRWGLPARLLQVWSLVNPIESFRLGMIAMLEPDASLLGPAGAALIGALGRQGLIAAASGSLAAWALLGYLAGRRAFTAAA